MRLPYTETAVLNVRTGLQWYAISTAEWHPLLDDGYVAVFLRDVQLLKFKAYENPEG